MNSVQWENLFTEHYPVVGATEDELQSFVTSVFSPLSAHEVANIMASQSNPFQVSDPLHTAYRPFDPCNWRLPESSFPTSYLQFLRWSNGGSFRNGDRMFDPIFGTEFVREYMLCYEVPQYMPGAVPFAFDGGGRFYLFDMRCPPVNGEYPILYTGAGCLDYTFAVCVGTTFIEALTQRTDPEEMYGSAFST